MPSLDPLSRGGCRGKNPFCEADTSFTSSPSLSFELFCVYSELSCRERLLSNKTRLTVEVFVHLVVATVFKTAEPYVNRAVGGFDSHTLPPFFLRVKFTCC